MHGLIYVEVETKFVLVVSKISWNLMPTFLEFCSCHWEGKADSVTSLQQETRDESEAGYGAKRHLEQRAVAEDYKGACNFTFINIEIIVFYCLTISHVLDYEIN